MGTEMRPMNLASAIPGRNQPGLLDNPMADN